MDARFDHLPVSPRFDFNISARATALHRAEFMPAWDLAGTIAVTPAGSLYLKLCGNLGWSDVTECFLSGYPRAEDTADIFWDAGNMLFAESIGERPLRRRLDIGGVGDATRRLVWGERIADARPEESAITFAQHETLPQHDYRNHPRAQAPEIELVIPYHCVPLSYALDGICYDPNEPIFALNTPIDEKLSICLGMEGVRPSHRPKDGFSSKQRRVRNKKNGPPIIRAKLARRIAADVQEFLKHYPVLHKGKPVDFNRLHLKEVCLKSKATGQPVLCIDRSPSPMSIPASRVIRSF
ncbi:hypothetical protein VTO73DRAFT_4789 [Trametes versicolor]